RKAVAAVPGAATSAATALDTALRGVEGAIVPLPVAGQIGEPAGLSAHYAALYGTLVGDGGYGAGSAEGRPTASRFQRKADLDRQWDEVRTRLQALTAEELARYNAEARARGVPELRLTPA
nr:hypothetical protein [Sandarakinorhabdus sp.]